MGASPPNNDRQLQRTISDSERRASALEVDDDARSSHAPLLHDAHLTPRYRVDSSPDDDSPATVTSSRYSITPRNVFGHHRFSATPTRTLDPSSALPLSPEDHGENALESMMNHTFDNGWGDDAMMQWQGAQVIDTDDDVSSVAPEEAGLLEDDGEDGWGKDAIIDFTLEDTDEGDSSAPEALDERPNVMENVRAAAEETTEELISRGMPDYSSWPVDRLQVSVALTDGDDC